MLFDILDWLLCVLFPIDLKQLQQQYKENFEANQEILKILSTKLDKR